MYVCNFGRSLLIDKKVKVFNGLTALEAEGQEDPLPFWSQWGMYLPQFKGAVKKIIPTRCIKDKSSARPGFLLSSLKCFVAMW